jgi:hypothetical protein
VPQVGDQPMLYYDAWSAIHQVIELVYLISSR